MQIDLNIYPGTRNYKMLTRFNRILFVCVGNICRSPMAEYWGRYQLQLVNKENKEIQIESAGLYALQNEPIAPEVKEILARYHIDTTSHYGKQINEELVIRADIIFTMEEWQKQELSLAFPSSHGKIFRIGKWRDEEIADPYRENQEVFENTFQLIRTNWDVWQNKLWRL